MGRRAKRKEFAPADPPDLVVVGLGNPESGYAGTRHNVGFEVLDVLAARAGLSWSKAKEGARVGLSRFDGACLALAKPQTFMNNSGQAVRPLLVRFGASADRLIVVYDEIDLAFGRLRLRMGGGTAGHQGLNSVANHLHTREFIRLRIGVGRPPGRMKPADYVLRHFTKDERREIDVLVEEAADAVVMVATRGLEAAMNRYNTARSDP